MCGANTSRFTSRRIATAAHEILTLDGSVIGWAVDEKWAAAIVAGLNQMVGEDAASLSAAGRDD